MFKPFFVKSVTENLKLCESYKHHVLDRVCQHKFPPVQSASIFSPSRCKAVRNIKAITDKIAEIAEEGRSLADIPMPSPASQSAEEEYSFKIPYQKFLSEGFEETHYFDYTFFSCSRNEIEKIKAQLTDFTFLLYCGRGQFGSVWLVKDLSEQIVALKLIPKKAFKKLNTEKAALTAYRSKIRNFEHLVQIYHVGQTDDFFYYTMEAACSISDKYYIPITLSRLLEHCFFAPKDCVDILLDVLAGLGQLHSNDLAHRDIKPENIILVDNKIKICDISLIMHKSQKNSTGTEPLLPQDIEAIPEECFGTDCDLFAAGKVLYTLLSNNENVGEFPYIARTLLCNKLAQKLNLIINKACAPSYKERYSDISEFIQALLKAKNSSSRLFDFF